MKECMFCLYYHICNERDTYLADKDADSCEQFEHIKCKDCSGAFDCSYCMND